MFHFLQCFDAVHWAKGNVFRTENTSASKALWMAVKCKGTVGQSI